MDRLRLLAVLSGCIGLVGAGTSVFRDSSHALPVATVTDRALVRETASLPDKPDSRLEQLQVQMNGLRLQLEAQQQTLARMRTNGSTPDHPADHGGVADSRNPATEDSRALAYNKTRQARLSKLEAELAEQVVDVGWSRAAEGQIEAAAEYVAEALTKDGVGQAPRLTEVTCRSSLCRLALGGGDELSNRQFVEQFPQRLGWREAHGLVQNITNKSGGMDTLIYLSREGQSLY